ncbi:MAG: germination protein YpeB [Clostridia bacterium]|nr:germination protein YpeB [Clostridia bacterium]
MKNFFDNLKKNYIYGILILLVIAIVVLGVFLYRQRTKYVIQTENQYNLAFYELIDYIDDVENYLAKSIVSSSAENGAKTLMHVWREANLAQVYLSQLPISSNELANTSKFLNQVSEYSYSLATKCINNEKITDEELNNLQDLYDYSTNLTATLEQLVNDMGSGHISWKELTKDTDTALAQQVDNLSSSSFSNLDKNFGEYEGLIYDGAYSEHIESAEKKGLTGNEISEEEAKNIVKEFVGNERIGEIISNRLVENGEIVVYDFSIKIKDGDSNNPMNISISKTGGHIVLMNYNREISEEKLSQEEANNKGKEFLESRGFTNMKETYYLKQGNSVTINYAYEQDGVVIYPDLIKLKIALDNGEILGMETTGYLNNHEVRSIPTPKISEEQAKENLNKNLEITSSGLAIIPTEWKTEIFCYEFKGKLNDKDFLVYINAENGKEENILVIIDTPNGVLTQ